MLFIMLVIFPSQNTYSQSKIWDETEEEKAERLSWWTDARFGMFIHWGIYALPARHEWVKNRERMTNEEYQEYFDNFNPDLYNLREWAKMAKNAGMKYAVITTKHHDGFCLFESEYTDYNATETPYENDLIKEWVEAFRDEGLGIGFYYSLIDWLHPHFTINSRNPQRVTTKKEFDKLNEGRNMSVYRGYLKN
jgi:alpha-L-fucosidase